jgi:hypothetical protein
MRAVLIRPVFCFFGVIGPPVTAWLSLLQGVEAAKSFPCARTPRKDWRATVHRSESQFSGLGREMGTNRSIADAKNIRATDTMANPHATQGSLLDAEAADKGNAEPVLVYCRRGNDLIVAVESRF